jgi:hypothetical protein
VFFAKYNKNEEVNENNMGRRCRKNGQRRNAHRILMWKPEGKRQL